MKLILIFALIAISILANGQGKGNHKLASIIKADMSFNDEISPSDTIWVVPTRDWSYTCLTDSLCLNDTIRRLIPTIEKYLQEYEGERLGDCYTDLESLELKDGAAAISLHHIDGFKAKQATKGKAILYGNSGGKDGVIEIYWDTLDFKAFMRFQ